MQREMQRRISPPSRGRANSRLAFWLPVICVGIVLCPAELLLGTNSIWSHALAPFPWFVRTLLICFVAGMLCALLATLRMESRRGGDIRFRGTISSFCAGLLNLGLWLVYLLINGIYTIYYPAPPVIGRFSLTLHMNWALLGLLLFLFLAVASVHVIVMLLGGMLGGLIKGIIVQSESNG